MLDKVDYKIIQPDPASRAVLGAGLDFEVPPRTAA